MKTPKPKKLLINFSINKDVVDELRKFKEKTGRTYSHIVETGIKLAIGFDKDKKNS